MTTTLAASTASDSPPPPNLIADRVKRRNRREARNAWGLLTPALIVIGVMTVYPAVLMVVQSFTDYTVKNKVQGTWPTFVGFENYVDLFTKSDFPAALMRSLGIMLGLSASSSRSSWCG